MRDVHFPCSGLFSILCSASIYNYGARARAHTLCRVARPPPCHAVERGVPYAHTRRKKAYIVPLTDLTHSTHAKSRSHAWHGMLAPLQESSKIVYRICCVHVSSTGTPRRRRVRVPRGHARCLVLRVSALFQDADAARFEHSPAVWNVRECIPEHGKELHDEAAEDEGREDALGQVCDGRQ